MCSDCSLSSAAKCQVQQMLSYLYMMNKNLTLTLADLLTYCPKFKLKQKVCEKYGNTSEM